MHLKKLKLKSGLKVNTIKWGSKYGISEVFKWLIDTVGEIRPKLDDQENKNWMTKYF